MGRIEFDAVLRGEARWAAVKGDSLETLTTLPDESIDAVGCDPPSGIDFMGKGWDCFRRKGNPADVGRPNVFGRTSRAAPHSYGESERGNFIAFIRAIMEQCLRVLKPGGHVLVWALPRTAHWTATAIEDAGFEIRDRVHDFLSPDAQIADFVCSLTHEQQDALWRIVEGQGNPIFMHLFGTGFPKNMNVAKALDKAAGIKPIGELPPSLGMATGPNADQWNALHRQLIMPPPTTADAVKWEGWGTALKPAVEHWILAKKPHKGPVYKNVIAHGTGAININGCRIAFTGEDDRASVNDPAKATSKVDGIAATPADAEGDPERAAFELTERAGRWPAHLIMQHAPGCQLVGERAVRTSMGIRGGGGTDDLWNTSNNTIRGDRRPIGYGDEDGNEIVPLWECVLACPVRALDAQTGKLASHNGTGVRRKGIGYKADSAALTEAACPGDEGGPSRFFYQAKASRREKNEGCEDLPTHTAEELTGRKGGSAGLVMQHVDGSAKANPYAGTSGQKPRANIHPTVKSIDLMRYLVRLITPPGGVVLDPFMGSGSTGVGALYEGLRFIGVDRDEDHDSAGNIITPGYVAIATARLRYADARRRGAEMMKLLLDRGVAWTLAAMEDAALDGFSCRAS